MVNSKGEKTIRYDNMKLETNSPSDRLTQLKNEIHVPKLIKTKYWTTDTTWVNSTSQSPSPSNNSI